MTTNWLFKLWGTMAYLAFATACSSSDDAPSEPAFPEKQTVTVAAGETHELQFSAEYEWRLTSDKPWVRFLMEDGQEELPVAYGDAGESTVTIVMKENGWAFDTEAAILSLTMENFTQPVFELTRPAKERIATMYYIKQTGDPQPTSGFNISYAERSRFQIGFQANFDWKIVALPEWLKNLEAITGEADVMPSKLERISLNDNFVPFAYTDSADPANAIVLSDRSGEHRFAFQLTYEGMPDDLMSYSPGTTMNSGIEFYYDRRVMYSGITGAAGPGEELEFEIEKVTVRNLEYTLKIVEYDKATRTAREIEASEAWMAVTADPQQEHAYSFKALSDYEGLEDRHLYLYILPPKYKTEPYDYASNFDENGSLNKSRNKYATRVTQLGKRLEGFVLLGGMTQEITLEAPVRLTDPALIEQYGTTNIYEKSFSEAEWTGRGQIQIQTNNLWSIRAVFESWTQWLKAQPQISGYKLALGSSRVAFASLPDEKAPIIIQDKEGKTYGVLFISKKQ